MFLTQEVSEGKHLDLEIFGDEPEIHPIYVRRGVDDEIPVEGQVALVYGDQETTIVGDTFEPISHAEAFSRMDTEIRKRFGPHVWKVQSGITGGTARARVLWSFWGPEMTYKARDEWVLQLRAFNSYDGFFPLSVDLGLVNTRHSGRVVFRKTRIVQRRRGKDPIGNWIPKSMELLGCHRESLEKPFDRMKGTPVDLSEVDGYLDQLTEKWITKTGKKEVKRRFEGESLNSMLDLVGLLGWYATSRLNVGGGQVVYRQELLYREISNLAKI